MRKGNIRKVLWSVVPLMVLFLGMVTPAWSASSALTGLQDTGTVVASRTITPIQSTPRESSLQSRVAVTEVQAWEFDSYEALVEWLEEAVKDSQELEGLLAQLELADPANGCLFPQTRPSSITVTKPFRFQVFQITFQVGVGNCGLVICARIQFSMEWFIAPPGGGFFFGPSPKITVSPVCQGDVVTTTGFVILTGQIPPGVYTLNFRAVSSGFDSTAVGGVMITVR